MNSDINLVSPKDDQSVIEKKRLRIVRNIAYVLAGIVVLFSIIVFIISTSFSNSSIKKQQESAINQLSMLKDKSAKVFVINNRILNIEKVLKQRNDFSSIESLLQIIPSSVKTNSLNFSEENISLTLISSSLLPLDDLINKYLDKVAKKQIIKNLSINSLNINEKTGNYFLTIKADFL